MQQYLHKFNFDIPSSQIHLWYCDLRKNVSRIDEYYLLLSSDEIEKAKRFKFEKDRNCYVISKAVLRSLLGGYLEKDPKEVNFEYTSFHKPMSSMKTPLKFNVSHSGYVAVFSFVKDVEIGVDIERIKDDFDVMDIAHRFFSISEIGALSKFSDSEKNRAFYRCWTRKESFIKAEGSGLSFPLDKFAVSINDDLNAELLETEWDVTEKNCWSLFSFVPRKEYIGAIAVRKKSAAVTFFNWNNFTERNKFP